jgi:hypothetical protein
VLLHRTTAPEPFQAVAEKENWRLYDASASF